MNKLEIKNILEKCPKANENHVKEIIEFFECGEFDNWKSIQFEDKHYKKWSVYTRDAFKYIRHLAEEKDNNFLKLIPEYFKDEKYKIGIYSTDFIIEEYVSEHIKNIPEKDRTLEEELICHLYDKMVSACNTLSYHNLEH